MTKKFLMFATCFSVVFLLSFCVFAQASSSEVPSSKQSASLTSSQTPSESDFNFNFTSSLPQEKSPSTFGLFVKMVFSLLIVLVLVYVAVYLLKKSTKSPDADDPFLRNVARISLGNGKSVQVVTLLDHAYIVGVAENSVTPIAQIDDKELVDSLNLYSDKNNSKSKPRSFADVLDIFMPHGPRESSFFEGSARNVSEQLKKQREHFNNGQ